jgi:hypothetical protein
MATASALPRARTVQPKPAVIVGVVAAAAAALYLWQRIPVVEHVQSRYAAICRGVQGRPTDPFCAMSWGDVAWPVLGSALLLGIGVAFPIAVLVAAGRRWTAAAPIAPAVLALPVIVIFRWLLGEGAPQGSWWRFGLQENQLSAWPDQRPFPIGWTDVALDVVLIAAPALAIALAVRPRRAPPVAISRSRFAFATFVCGAGVAVVLWAAPKLGMSSDIYNAFAGFDGDVFTVAGMALFGATLGTDRRWWPWVIPFTAVLFAGAPALLLSGLIGGWTTFTGFGTAVVLTAVGLVASAWGPIAYRGIGVERAVGTGLPRALERPRVVRPRVVLDALAIAVVIASIAMFRADPLPIQISTSLPTYLGARTAVQDVVARRTLVDALDAADAYAAEAGSYAGFGVPDARVLAPEIEWAASPGQHDLVVAVDRTKADLVRVLTISGSGASVCMQRDASGRTTWAQIDRSGEPADGLGPAAAACGLAVVTLSVTRGPDVETLCDPLAGSPGGLDDSLLVCRSVQRLMRGILAGETP